MHCLTLASNFRVPLLREYILAYGLRSASRASCLRILAARHGAPGPGAAPGSPPAPALLLVPGGAAESLLSTPGSIDLARCVALAAAPARALPLGPWMRALGPPPPTAANPPLANSLACTQQVLKRRRGFVRIALQAGASLVPCLAFGEAAMYDTFVPPRGSVLFVLQRQLAHAVGTAAPLFAGRAFFAPELEALGAALARAAPPALLRAAAAAAGALPPLRWAAAGARWLLLAGIMPRPVPLTVVCGAPIDIPEALPPGAPGFEERAQALHAAYIAALRALHAKHAAAATPPGAPVPPLVLAE